MFKKFDLNFSTNLFTDLSTSVDFEDMCTGPVVSDNFANAKLTSVRLHNKPINSSKETNVNDLRVSGVASAASGRKAATLIDYRDGLIPLVRTTSVYHKPNQKFLPIHFDIIDSIKKTTNYENLEFNNALIEMYNSDYYKMRYQLGSI